MKTVQVTYLNNIKKPEPKKEKKERKAKGLHWQEWIKWVLEETGGVGSIDLSTHMGGASALRNAATDHQGHMDVRNPMDEIELEEVEVKEDEDAAEYRMRLADDLSDDEIDTFETYIRLVEQRNNSKAFHQFITLVQAKDQAWKKYTELHEFICLRWTNYAERVDGRMAVLAAKGQEPTKETWDVAMAYLDKLAKYATREYKGHDGQWRTDYNGMQGPSLRAKLNKRFMALYNEAKVATDSYKAFWETETGQEMTLMFSMCKDAWMDLEAAGLTTEFWRYYSLKGRIINPQWWIDIDRETSAEADDPSLLDMDRSDEWIFDKVQPKLHSQVSGELLTEDFDWMVAHPPADKSRPTEEEVREAKDRWVEMSIEDEDEMYMQAVLEQELYFRE